MTTSSPSSTNGLTRSDRIFFLTIFSVTFIFLAALAMFYNAKDEIHKERIGAWQEMVSSAATPQQRDLMSYLASRIPGCFINPSTDPSRLGAKFSWTPSKYKNQYRARLIAHEQACLANLRGETLAYRPEGMEMINEVSVPQ